MKKPELHIFSNGLKVILYSSNNFITNSILVLVKSGTDYEDSNNNGISHFLEHLFFKGTKNFETPEKLGFELDKIGAEYNAFTSYEYTGYYIKTLPEYFERAIFIMSDLLINPLFDEREVEKEKNVIIEEINYHKDNPLSFIFDETLKLCYGNQPAGWSILGTEENIRKISSEDIKNYFRKHYCIEKSLIVVSGNFNKKKIIKLLENYFKNYPKNKIINKNKIKKVKGFNGKIYYKNDVSQSHIVMLFRIPGLMNLKENRHTISLLATILGSGMSSRLFKTIREELGLSYYIRASVDFYTDRGYIFIQSGSKLDKTTLAVEKILEEVYKLKKEKISKEEFEKGLAILKNTLFSSLESSLNIAYFIGLDYLLMGKMNDITKVLNEINKIKIDDLYKVAQKYFKKENLTYGILSHPDFKQINLQDIFYKFS